MMDPVSAVKQTAMGERTSGTTVMLLLFLAIVAAWSDALQVMPRVFRPTWSPWRFGNPQNCHRHEDAQKNRQWTRGFYFGCDEHMPVKMKGAISLKSLTGLDEAELTSASADSRAALPPTTRMFVDVENVRGRISFTMPHEEVISRATTWWSARRRQNADVTKDALLVLVLDHGLELTAALLPESLDDTVALVFAGPDSSADDVMKDFVQHASSANDSVHNVVVTADEALVKSLRMPKEQDGKIVVWDPRNFLAEIEESSQFQPNGLNSILLDLDEFPDESRHDGEAAVATIAEEEKGSLEETNEQDGDVLAHSMSFTLSQLQRQQKAARLAVRSVDDRLAARAMSNKERSKLLLRRDKARAKLADVAASVLKTITISGMESGDTRATRELINVARTMQETKRSLVGRKSTETSKERQVLVETLRRRLMEAGRCEYAAFSKASQVLPWIETGETIDAKDDNDDGKLQEANGEDEYYEIDDADSELVKEELKNKNRQDSGGEWEDPLSEPLVIRTRQSLARSASDPDLAETECAETSIRPIRIVAISDTHGFEKQLWEHHPADAAKNEEPGKFPLLPPADVLIHCGDFWGSSGHRRSLRSTRKRSASVDAFLAAQTHIPAKIVVRGNHDPAGPGSSMFPRSGALYATRSQTVTIGGIVIALEPWGTRLRGAKRGLAPCDILVSHVPPFGVLDYTYKGDMAGSSSLRHKVECAQTKPRLWLCGHIHESRGAERRHFEPRRSSHSPVFLPVAEDEASGAEAEQAMSESTLVVNVANANPGRAQKLVAGAVVLDVERHRLGPAGTATSAPRRQAAVARRREVLSPLSSFDAVTGSPPSTAPPVTANRDSNVSAPQNPNSGENNAKTESLEPPRIVYLGALAALSSIDERYASEDVEHRRLLSVDLGLRTANAVYDGKGKLLAVNGPFQFQTTAAMEESLSEILRSNNITHVILEGNDVEHMEAWARAVWEVEQEIWNRDSSGGAHQRRLKMARMTAEEWRRGMLLERERKNSKAAKTAASLIARQVLATMDGGARSRSGKISSHEAEAILVGYYAAHTLGWGETDAPVVRRYVNGFVVR